MPQRSDFIPTTDWKKPRQKKSQQLHQECISGVCLSLLLLTAAPAIAGAGHGDEAFSSGSASDAKPVKLDANDAAQIGIESQAVIRKPLAFGIPTTGQIETAPDRKAAVTTPVTGTVIKFFVKPGDLVKTGQPVAILLSPELASLRTESLTNRAEAEADLQKAQAALQRAQQNYQRQTQIADAEIEQAKIALNYARERSDKDTALLEKGVIPRRQLLDSEEKLAEAKATLARTQSRLQILEAQEQLKSTQSDVKVAQSRLQLSDVNYRTRLRQLGSDANSDGTVTIRAPISGRVVDREASVGESASDPGKPLMTIVNDSIVLATANVYEKDLAQIEIGQPVRVTVSSLPNRIFNGRVTLVGSLVQGQSRSLPVKAQLENPDGTLKPGMFAKMEIVTDRSYASALAVPKSAIIDANGKTLVFHQEEGNIYEPVEVKLGRSVGNLVEVKSGVEDGDRVVTQGTTLLYAQALKGGTPKEEENNSDEQPEGEKEASIAKGGLPLPWWLAIPGVGAVAGGMFWLGRRSKPPLILQDSKYTDPDYKPDFK